MQLVLAITFLEVLRQLIKLVIVHTIINHPELSKEQVEAMTSMYKH